ncbi:MAG: hypothetical protein E6559_08010, partial [Pantoea sp.]|nr:hypothetical protein [Pantoea sp.]
DTQLQIDYYRPVRNERILFGGQGTGLRWDDSRMVEYLTSRIRASTAAMRSAPYLPLAAHKNSPAPDRCHITCVFVQFPHPLRLQPAA